MSQQDYPTFVDPFNSFSLLCLFSVCVLKGPTNVLGLPFLLFGLCYKDPFSLSFALLDGDTRQRRGRNGKPNFLSLFLWWGNGKFGRKKDVAGSHGERGKKILERGNSPVAIYASSEKWVENHDFRELSNSHFLTHSSIP